MNAPSHKPGYRTENAPRPPKICDWRLVNGDLVPLPPPPLPDGEGVGGRGSKSQIANHQSQLAPVRLLVLVLSLAACARQEKARIEEHVRYLASDALDGRLTGTDGERLAGDYIAGQFRRAGIEPEFQEFVVHGGKGRNVVGVVKGGLDEAVVVGAHYDHLGSGRSGIYHGADDNASGVAAILEVAGRFAKRPARRAVVFVAFSGEEKLMGLPGGLLGSRHYVSRPAVPLEKTVAMINLDMVGRLGEKLTVFGTDSGDKFKEYLAGSPLRIAYPPDPVGPSDHTSFYMKGIPAVHFFTGSHADYHKPGDTADKINYAGLGRIADLVETVARRVADAPERMKFQKVEMSVAAAPDQPAPRGATPYFGSMPDYAWEGKGVRLSGVAPGSPAEKAGLKEGDVILKFNGQDIPDVNVYSKLLFSSRPGQTINVVYDRGGKQGTAEATLAMRRKASEE